MGIAFLLFINYSKYLFLSTQCLVLIEKTGRDKRTLESVSSERVASKFEPCQLSEGDECRYYENILSAGSILLWINANIPDWVCSIDLHWTEGMDWIEKRMWGRIPSPRNVKTICAVHSVIQLSPCTAPMSRAALPVLESWMKAKRGKYLKYSFIFLSI